MASQNELSAVFGSFFRGFNVPNLTFTVFIDYHCGTSYLILGVCKICLQHFRHGNMVCCPSLMLAIAIRDSHNLLSICSEICMFMSLTKRSCFRLQRSRILVRHPFLPLIPGSFLGVYSVFLVLPQFSMRVSLVSL